MLMGKDTNMFVRIVDKLEQLFVLSPFRRKNYGHVSGAAENEQCLDFQIN